MFITLLAITLVIALLTSLTVVWLFRGAIRSILARIVSAELSTAWHRYLDFAIVVVGTSGGVRIWELEKYITPRSKDMATVALTTDRWVLELYRTLIGSLQSCAWLLLVFFVAALIAYVVVRGFELRRAQADRGPG